MEIVHLEETENHFLFQNISGISVRSFLESFWISKKLIYKLERSKALTVNAETVGFDFVLQSRDVIKISLEEFEKETLIPHEGPLTVIYEDADLLLVNKPPGILVHPDGTGKLSLDNLVAHHYLRKGLKRKASHAYRRDYHASGLLLYPKHFLAAAHINHQLENGMMKKLYYAVVEVKVEGAARLILELEGTATGTTVTVFPKPRLHTIGFCRREKSAPCLRLKSKPEGGTKSASISAISGIRLWGTAITERKVSGSCCMHFIFPFNIRGPESARSLFYPYRKNLQSGVSHAHIHRHQISRLP